MSDINTTIDGLPSPPDIITEEDEWKDVDGLRECHIELAGAAYSVEFVSQVPFRGVGTRI